MILHEIDNVDRAIYDLYESFDVPADEIVVRNECLKRFSYAVARLVGARHGLPNWASRCRGSAFQTVLQKRLLYLRKRAADRRRQGLPSLAKLGRKWEGPNQGALNERLGELINAD